MTTYREFLSDNLFPDPVVYTVQSETLNCDGVDSVFIAATASAVSMAAVVCASATDITAATDLFTKTHTFQTGSVVQVATSDTLPAGLSALTDYYVIRLTSGTFKLASSLANALAGTAVDITDVGVGDQTITAAATGTCDLSVMVSCDNTVFVPYAAAVSVTSTGIHVSIDRPKFTYFYVKLTLTDNQFTVYTKALFKDFFNNLK